MDRNGRIDPKVVSRENGRVRDLPSFPNPSTAGGSASEWMNWNISSRDGDDGAVNTLANGLLWFLAGLSSTVAAPERDPQPVPAAPEPNDDRSWNIAAFYEAEYEGPTILHGPGALVLVRGNELRHRPQLWASGAYLIPYDVPGPAEFLLSETIYAQVLRAGVDAQVGRYVRLGMGAGWDHVVTFQAAFNIRVTEQRGAAWISTGRIYGRFGTFSLAGTKVSASAWIDWAPNSLKIDVIGTNVYAQNHVRPGLALEFWLR